MAVIAPINASTFQAGAFLTHSSYAIPDLQRPYAWSKIQAEELVADLWRIVDGTTEAGVPQHFFGTIVLLSSNSHRLDIIDGQQRLTTISILLGAIETSARALSIAARKKGGPNGAAVSLNIEQFADDMSPLFKFHGSMDFQGKIQNEPRLLVSPEIRKTFQSLISGGNGEVPEEQSKPAKNIREIAEIFRKTLIEEKSSFKGDPLEKFRHLKKVHDAVREGLLIVSLQTSSSDAGYDLFESLNARGVDLNALDLIKVWMLNKLSGEDSSDVARSMRELSSDDVSRQTDFFKDFYKARALRNVGKVSDKDLALNAREYVFKDPLFDVPPQATTLSQRIRAEVDLMERWTPIWTEIGNRKIPSLVQGEQIERAWAEHRLDLLISYLRHTGASRFLFMVASDELQNNLPKLSWFIHTIERFFFRYKTMCGGPVSNIDTAYFKFIEALRTNGDLDQNFVNKTLQALIDEHADDAKFKQRIFERLDYEESGAREKIKYFLWTLECYAYKGSPKKMIQDLGEWHLEHIYPQNPASGVSIGEDVHLLGNICLLNPEINNSLNNLEFAAKKKKIADLKKNGINLDTVDSRSVFESDSDVWTRAEISKRSDDLRASALDVFSFR